MTSNGDEDRRHRHRYHNKRRRHDYDGETVKSEAASPPLLRGLKLTEEFANKSLYICSFEYNKSIYPPRRLWGAYVVRAINLSDLLSSSNDSLEFGQVGYRAGEDLPANGGCGVLGSQIVFTSGLKRSPGPSGPAYGPRSSKQVYAFDTKDPKHHEIVNMDATVHEGKHEPLMAEVAGKLYALSCKPFGGSFDSFEVFDPKQGSWSLLPEFPRSGYWFSCAVAGTKLFVSVQNHPVFCFDVAADPSKQEWTRVPSMCRGGPFPFQGKALVLDLPHHNKKKLMFTSRNYEDYGRRCRILVYLMSLYENRETITPIHELKLPELPPGEPRDYHFLHLGGHNVCLVITSFRNPHDYDEPDEPGTHNIRGAAIPFHFEFDISKVDQDKNNCFTVQFLPPRIYEYHTNPSSTPLPETLGCFVLYHQNVPAIPLLDSTIMSLNKSNNTIILGYYLISRGWTIVNKWAEIPPSDDALKIRFLFCKETQHAFAFGPSKEDVCEEFEIPQTEKVITIRPSELCNEDTTSIKQSYSIRMIEDFINTEYPPTPKRYRSLIVDQVIELVQNSIGSPLSPNRVLDVKLSHGITILHDTRKRVLDIMEDTRLGTCSICTDDFEVGCRASRLPCLHIFHGLCIVKWLRINPNCPICRYPIPPERIAWF